MPFSVETFCKNCDGLTEGKIRAEIQAKLIELEGRLKAMRKKDPFPDKNLDRQYQNEIRKLETMAEFLAGDRSNGNFLTETEAAMFQQVVDNLRQP